MKTRFLFATAFLIQSLFCAAQKAWTLQDCIEYAITNNVQIQQAEINEHISKNNLLQSELNLLPSISGAANYNFTFGYSISPVDYQYSKTNSQQLTTSLNSSLTLINGLQKINTIRKSKADAQAAGFDKQNTINNTTLQLTNYFLQVLLNKELLAVAQSQLDISATQLDQAKAKLKAGTMAEAEIYQFESAEASNNASMIQAKNNLSLSILQLKIALQLPDSVGFDVAAPNITNHMLTDISRQTETELYSQAVYNQPAIKSAQAKVASAIYGHKIAIGSLSPSISFNFMLGDNYYDQAAKVISISPYVTEPISFRDQFKNNLQKIAGFNLQVPIFSGWSRMTNISNSKLQRQIQELELSNQKNKFRQDIQQAFNNAKGARETYFANEKAAISARKSYEAYQKRFSVGMSNSFELQQAQTNLYKAESQSAQSKYSYLLYLKILDFYQGKPIRID